MNDSIISVIYNITIYPFELIIESISELLRQTDQGAKLIIMGILVNIISLPLYNIADKMQKKELDLQASFKAKLDEISSVFKGDKKQMIIQTFYRINNYHPIYSLRGLFGLIIQVPIFIAAYKVITSMNSDKSFLMIRDLSKPDALLSIGTFSINLLPFVMTFINIISSLVHTREQSSSNRDTKLSPITSGNKLVVSIKGLFNKERMPLFIMALLFLVLLYNSPSALLVYWITTNLFSLVKNIILLKPQVLQNFFKRTRIFWYVLSIIWLLSPLVFYFQFAKAGTDAFRVIMPGIIAIVIAYINILSSSKIISENFQSNTKIFFISLISVTILFGFFIPSSLIASSPEEFENPFNIIMNTFSKSIGIFLTYPTILYFFSTSKVKRIFTLLTIFIFLFAIGNTFIFSGDYGTLSSNLILSNKDGLITTPMENILNFSFAIIILLLIWKKIFYKEAFKIIATFSVIILFLISSLNIYNIKKETGILLESEKNVTSNINKIIDLSINGKNVFVLFFDAAVSSHIPKIIEQIPELKNELDGFKYYSNTLSFGAHTVSTISALFGGYEYTPIEMNKRNKESLKDKHDESIMVLPLIFRSNNYSATVIYPTYAGWKWEPNISSQKKYLDVKTYSRAFALPKNKNTEEMIKNFDKFILNISLFRISPMALRYSIYDDGNWLLGKYNSRIPLEITEYAYLKELTNMINIVSNTNTYTYFGNDMTHDSHYFNSNYLPEPEKKEVPIEDIEKYGDEITARRVYNNTRMLIEVASFVKFLKTNNMYDNSKIIIVSDHGDINLKPPVFDDSILNFNESVNNRLQALNATLLVKDFDSRGMIKMSPTNFMTVADMPIIATSHLSNVINPFTKKELKANKENGIKVVMTPFSPLRQNLNTFIIEAMIKIENGNIFDMNNWTRISNVSNKKDLESNTK